MEARWRDGPAAAAWTDGRATGVDQPNLSRTRRRTGHRRTLAGGGTHDQQDATPTGLIPADGITSVMNQNN